MESLLVQVQSGQGALRINQSAKPNPDPLNAHTLTKVVSPEQPIGVTKVNGILRRRFGNVGKAGGSAFDFPKGEPGVYAIPVPGYEGKGNLGDGSFNSGGHQHKFHYSEDILEAQGVVDREVHFEKYLGKANHVKFMDRTTERLEHVSREMIDTLNARWIKHLASLGFTDEEILAKYAKNRAAAIDRAEKMPHRTGMLQETLKAMSPMRLDEYEGAPGAVPSKRDSTSYDRAVNALTLVQRKKAYQAANRERELSGAADATEEPIERPQEEETAREILARIRRELASEREKIAIDKDQVREDQKKTEDTKRQIRANILAGVHGERPKALRPGRADTASLGDNDYQTLLTQYFPLKK